jgi:hypothetical protein
MRDRLRFTRQIRLPEIGEAGQERLEAAQIALSAKDGDAQAFELGYLAAAGITVIEGQRASAVAEGAFGALGLKDPAARAVGEGALRALVAMKEILGA